MINEFNPDWRSPPGDTIKDILDERGQDALWLACELEGTLDFLEVQQLLEGELELTADLADDLTRLLGASPEFWIEREANYRKPL